MGLDSDPLVPLEPSGQVHLFTQGFELSRDAVAVVPSESACGGKIDFGHDGPHMMIFFPELDRAARISDKRKRILDTDKGGFCYEKS